MPRTARAAVADMAYHVINRGNGKARVFHDEADFDAFVRLLGEASDRVAMRIAAWCVMPNHFHLVLWPPSDDGLSRWMQWLMTAHVRRHHRRHATSGHLWQGRFKAFPIQRDDHLLTVVRYVERNPVRAGLVSRAEDWRWSSLAATTAAGAPERRCPVPLPGDWGAVVAGAEPEAELEAVRQSVNRGTPFGAAPWISRTARRLGLEHTTRPRGRPPKRPKK
jgi:putative transposase